MTDYTAKIAALEDAAASGELRIEADGEMVIYRSMTDLLKALEYFRGQQSTQSNTRAGQTTLAVYCPD